MLTFKENDIVSIYTGELVDFTTVRDGLDILITISNIFTNSLIDFSLGGITLTRDIDFTVGFDEIRLIERDDSFLSDNTNITIFKNSNIQSILDNLSVAITDIKQDIDTILISDNSSNFMMNERFIKSQNEIASIVSHEHYGASFSIDVFNQSTEVNDYSNIVMTEVQDSITAFSTLSDSRLKGDYEIIPDTFVGLSVGDRVKIGASSQSTIS